MKRNSIQTFQGRFQGTFFSFSVTWREQTTLSLLLPRCLSTLTHFLFHASQTAATSPEPHYSSLPHSPLYPGRVICNELQSRRKNGATLHIGPVFVSVLVLDKRQHCPGNIRTSSRTTTRTSSRTTTRTSSRTTSGAPSEPRAGHHWSSLWLLMATDWITTTNSPALVNSANLEF